MKNQITIREALTEKDTAQFWEQLHSYFKHDIFPDPADEDREYFLGNEYRGQMQMIHDRGHNRCEYLFFSRGGRDIGFALPVIYDTEDGKCFIMEFCVYPEYRGNGTGRACACVLLERAREKGAKYAELNSGGSARREKFWQSLGFVKNGADEWGEPLMLLPPEEKMPITVEILTDPDDWQLRKLENGFLSEIGEEMLNEERQLRLAEAVREGRISFLVARRGCRAVGMCSVAAYWSSFSCGEVAVFEDFYIEPAFRRKGIARMLANAAQRLCAERGIASLRVCCAPCDEQMYRSLGFDTQLGTSLARLI